MTLPTSYDKVERNQKLTKPGYIELYTLVLETVLPDLSVSYDFVNLTPVTGDGSAPVEAFINGPYQQGMITFLPIPIQIQGIKSSATNEQPGRPVVSMSAMNPQISALIRQYNNLLGQTLIRYKTYVDLLSEGSDYWGGYEQYNIIQKVKHNATVVSFMLCSPLDKPKKLPTEIVTLDEFPSALNTQGY